MSEAALSTCARMVEAILFLETDSVTLEQLAKFSGYTILDVSQALTELTDYFRDSEHGIELVLRGSEYQFLPKKDLWPDLKERYARKIDKRLTRAALETLSIIAYSQPITRKEIEAIRGVSSENILRILKDKDLIRITGTKEGPGRPALYGTTKKFLKNFNLSSISSLPKLSEIDEERFLLEEEYEDE